MTPSCWCRRFSFVALRFTCPSDPDARKCRSSDLFDYYFSDAWMMTMPQTMMSGISRFVLIALPFFVLAGGLMNAGGISGRLFEFARAIVGSLRGRSGHVNVMTSMFFGGMIGSSTADLAGTGSIVIPKWRKMAIRRTFPQRLRLLLPGSAP